MDKQKTHFRNKGFFVTIAFTEDEKEKAKAYARKERIALGTIMRKMILDKADESNEKDLKMLSEIMPSEKEMDKLKADIKRSRGRC